MQKKIPNLLPDINDYLLSKDNLHPVKITGLEDLVSSISAKTNLDKEKSEIVLRLFFQEIRNSILNKEKVNIRSLGKLFVSSPEVTNNKRNIFVKFKPARDLIRKLNARQNTDSD